MMAKLNDQLLVVSLNYTCWDLGKQPPYQISEIIEVGLCLLDLTSLVVGQRHTLWVRPMKSVVSKFCTDKTLISSADLEDAEPLVHVCDELRAEFNSKYRPWATWGGYDQLMMEACCKLYNVSWPLSQTCVDFKNVFAIFTGSKREVEIDDAMVLVGLEYEGRIQRGCDRAFNICRLAKSLLWKARKTD